MIKHFSKIAAGPMATPAAAAVPTAKIAPAVKTPTPAPKPNAASAINAFNAQRKQISNYTAPSQKLPRID